jgi:hypothetical protein
MELLLKEWYTSEMEKYIMCNLDVYNIYTHTCMFLEQCFFFFFLFRFGTVVRSE